jgi:hypothetical protein
MVKKPCQRLDRAIKTPFKILVEGVFVVLSLFLIFSPVKATSLDDFETRDVGNISGQGNWTGWFANVVDDFSYTGSKSITNPRETPRTYYYVVYTFNETATSGAVKWWNYRTPSSDNCSNVFSARISNGDNIVAYFIDSAWASDCDILAGWKDDATETLSAMIWNEWYSSGLAWRLTGSSTYEVAFALNDVWTDWKPAVNNIIPTRIYISFSSFQAVWFDDLETTIYVPVVCSNYSYEGDCEANENCIWYFDEWLWQNHFIPYQWCTEKTNVAGYCGTDFDTCQYCVSSTTCEAQDFCYWHNGNCWYGTGTCGEGLALQFCLDQSSCESSGGNWYSDYCWLSPKPNLLNWSEYYAEYGDYATPSAFIDNLASGTEGLLVSIGGFLTTFKDFFDIQNAYQKGKDFGSAIPTARGYLNIFNDFFGSFPVSQMFIFILIITLAVGVFRIVRHFRQITKPL